MPNPFNNIAGFSIREHYFFPGFPVMAHPMAEWVLETYYADRFNQTERGSRSVYVFDQPESRITPIMEHLEHTYAGIRSYSLPTVGRTDSDGRYTPPHIEFGDQGGRRGLPLAGMRSVGRCRCRVCRQLARL